MRVPNLAATLAAVAMLAAGAMAGVSSVESLEDEYVHAFAPQHASINVTGSALQKMAFRQDDLLPIYGGSEVVVQPSSYQSSEFFRPYPTGFETFEVAKGGAASLITAQQLAALGEDLKGKKVVVSFAPADFQIPAVTPDAYAASYSGLHASELAFSDMLSFETKQLAARRMLQYPDTLDSDLLLKFALQNLANGSTLSRALYTVVWPLGKLHTFIYELQDQYETYAYINRQIGRGARPTVKRQPATIDWKALAAQAEKEQIPLANNNPFGIDNDIWNQYFAGKFKSYPPGTDDKYYSNQQENSQEWVDFDIMLRVLKDMGAQPLLLGRPQKADYLLAIGVSTAVLPAYYARLHQVAQPYDFPVVDMAEHQNDHYFSVDTVPHTSRLGWVYVDQILDEFYHGNLR